LFLLAFNDRDFVGLQVMKFTDQVIDPEAELGEKFGCAPEFQAGKIS